MFSDMDLWLVRARLNSSVAIIWEMLYIVSFLCVYFQVVVYTRDEAQAVEEPGRAFAARVPHIHLYPSEHVCLCSNGYQKAQARPVGRTCRARSAQSQSSYIMTGKAITKSGVSAHTPNTRAKLRNSKHHFYFACHSPNMQQTSSYSANSVWYESTGRSNNKS